MIRLDVKDYCQQCLDFDPDVDMPQKIFGTSPDGSEVEFILSDTVIRCSRRRRCEGIKRYLDRQREDSKNVETD